MANAVAEESHRKTPTAMAPVPVRAQQHDGLCDPAVQELSESQSAPRAAAAVLARRGMVTAYGRCSSISSRRAT